MRLTYSRIACVLLTALLVGACDSPTAVDARITTLEVAPTTTLCQGMVVQQCLRVREPGESDWRLFYDSIEGFTFEPGFRHMLRIAIARIPDPPADGSSFRYRLIAVLAKVAVPLG